MDDVNYHIYKTSQGEVWFRRPSDEGVFFKNFPPGRLLKIDTREKALDIQSYLKEKKDPIAKAWLQLANEYAKKG